MSQAITESQIRETAYFIWLDEGQPTGCDAAHWEKAVTLLTPRTPAVKKTKAAAKPAKAAAAKPVKAKTAKKPVAKAATTAAPKTPRKAKTAQPAAALA